MNIPIPKLKALILYFATNTDPRLLGKIKLMKLFYFVDFTHVKKYASPITFDNYVHLEHGPVPSTILNLVTSAETDLDDAILADTISVEVQENSLQKRIIPTRKFSEKDAQIFTPSELAVMKEVCERFADKTGKFIEDRSHEESAFVMTKELEEIPYTLAVHDLDCLSKKEEIEFVLNVFK